MGRNPGTEGKREEQESMGRAATSVERDRGAVQPGAGLSLPRRCAASQGRAASTGMHWPFPSPQKPGLRKGREMRLNGTTWEGTRPSLSRVTARVGSWLMPEFVFFYAACAFQKTKIVR